MKKTNSVMLSCLIALTWLATGNPVHAASPVIKDFSSEGGHARNKDNAKDTMYLAKPADKITFKVKAEGAGKYEWLVNKAVQKAKGDTFTWTVPNKKGVWEIHLKVSSEDGEAHQEWVVSTLTNPEAPVLFDYFCPDRSQKDPWGRPLPKWDKEIAAPDFMVHGRVRKPSKVAYGTWIFRRKLGPKGKRRSFGCTISRDEYIYRFSKPLVSGQWDFRVPSQYGPIYTHSMGRSAMGECCSTWYDNTDDWHLVRIVRTKDGWFWIWIGGELWFESLANENTLKKIDSLFLYSTLLDCVEIYDRPVWPAKSIRFGEYRDDFAYVERERLYAKEVKRTDVIINDFVYAIKKYRGKEFKRTGVVIDGHGVTLKDIAEAISDPKIFRYDPAIRTATCYTDLVIKPGAELVIDDETLKMHCNKDGEHQIRVKNCSTIRLNKATITSDNEFYYLWAFTSACKWEEYKRNPGGYPSCSFSGRLLATDSTISNCANFFPDTPGELVLKRCKLVDLVEVDIGNYWKKRPGAGGGHSYDTTKRMAARGKKGVWFYNRKELVDFRIEDCTIYGKDKPIDITFIGGDDLHKVTISNCDLDNIAAKKGYRFRDWRDIYIYETEQMSCTISLLNCKFKELKAQSSKAWIMPKYYLDVLAVDKAGKPIPGCKVRVVNEADDIRYPAENLLEKRYWVEQGVTENRWIKVWLDVNDLRATVPAGRDGRTALPEDKANTLVLTDFIQGENERQDFTYTVQVTAPDGRFGERKGVNPGPGWYRQDPNKPTRTIKVVVDKAARPAQPVRKPRPAVKTARSPWPSFRGPDYAHTGRSPYVGPSKSRVLWRYKTNGEILESSPVIGPDGTIYVAPEIPDFGFHAVNPDGSRKWRYQGTPPGTTKWYFAPSVGLDGIVYVGAYRGSFGSGGSGRTRRLLAIGPEGKLRWEYEHPIGHVRCFPIPGPDGTIYFAAGCYPGRYSREYRVYSISSDGKLKWASEIKEGISGSSHILGASSPAIAPDGTVYVGGSFSMSAVHALKADGTIKWAYKTKGRVQSSPAISVPDKTVYVGCREGRASLENVRGHLLALGFDGSLKWSYKVSDEITSSPAVGRDGTVYFGSRDGYFYALRKDGKLKWKFKTGDCVHSSPAVDAEGKIYFGSHDHYLYCLSPKGKLLWKYLTGGSVVSSPAIGVDGTIYVGSADGYLYAFGK